jgi:hypothetical protein
VEYCTDLDIHSDPGLLPNYRLLLSVGHDEYWSQPLRSNVEAFVSSGGNIAFLSGDTCWWRVHLVDNDTAMVCLKGNETGGDDQWWNGLPLNPENALTCVSYRNGGGWWPDKRDQIGYTVQFCDHWVFDGTGLADGQVIGAAVVPPVIGYECDGAQFSRDSAGRAVPTGADGTPSDFTILGVGVLTSGWHIDVHGKAMRRARTRRPWGSGRAARPAPCSPRRPANGRGSRRAVVIPPLPRSPTTC